MIEPARPQGLEAAPAVADADGDAEDVPELTVEVAEVALRMVDDPDREIRQARETLSQDAHDDALAGTGIAVHEGEAALAQVSLLDAPAEALDLGRHVERLDRDLRDEGVVFEPVEGQELLVHVGSSSGVGRYAGGSPVAA